MSTFGRDRPVFLKTYGRQKRKLDQWFSPDLRKKAFSFSSTPSSDQSIPENSYHKKRKKKSTAAAASRTAQRAMTALKELESDEENIPASDYAGPRNKIGAKPSQKAAVTKKPAGMPSTRASRNQQTTQRAVRVRKKKQQQQQQQILSSSEDEDDSFMIRKKPSSVLQSSLSGTVNDRTRRRVSTAAPPLGRFVTRRRRAMPIQPEKPTSKESFRVPNSSLNSSEDFVRAVPSLPRCVTRRKRPALLENFRLENSDPKCSAASLSSSQALSHTVLREVSLNDSEEQRMSCKRPLLCSTPFLASKRNLPYLEPSIIELSSFSCDDIDRPPAKTTTSTSTTEPMIKPQTSRNKSLQNNQLQRSNCQRSSQEVELVGQVEECAESAHQHPVQKRQGHEGREDQACERGQMSPSVEFASARTHLDSQVEQLKDRCRSASAVVVLEKVDVSDVLSTQSLGGKLEVEEMCSPCLEMELPASTNAEETWNSSHGSALSGSCPEPLYITSSLSPSFSSLTIPPPAPSSPPAQFSDPAQALIDRLKLECLSSCLTVTLQPLDHRFQQQAPVKSPEAQAVSAPPPETKRGSLNSQADLSSGSDGQKTGVVRRLSASYGVPSVPAVKSPEAQAVPAPPPESKCGHSGSLNSQADLSSESDGQKTGVVRRLSASYGILAVSPAADVAPNKARTLVVQKERGGAGAGAGAGAGTGRKACVSGLSVSRWSKRDVGDKRQRKNDGRTRTKPGDCSLNYLLPARMTQTGESMCDWLPGNSGIGLPGTPIRLEQLNLSVLANFTPDTLTTHNWGRLKAALSIHKKKTAFPTPRRLALSNLKSPGGMDTSLDLFGTPLVSCTPLSKLASSRLLYSSMTNTSMGPDEDISDAEKVYQECQQDGPLSFEDCIPPEQMKCCTKIGEGTFGEVFSTINSSSQTVALKIIPVEGSEKVNGEVQKTFGEILHEIIISKELSSLDSKENNKTNGFIGLNNLHCVQGCYPSALLKAWDKFDQEKTSENDRPDFFSKEQLFVILEFEFGGSDLENMNGKLTSMAQAKSLLHQVTAALAVAEQALCFEHRDLHWGNILVKTTKQKHTDFILNGSVYSVETRGVHVNIIDYSLSRLEIDGLTVSCDIANDEELFMGQGDYQFEIYRLMKNENNNCWGEYNPHSNVLWLHYLVDKLLTMKYKTKAQSSQQKTLKSSLKSFQSEILSYRSATDALQHCRLFQ